MRCVKCGTEFIGWPCPTCERNRLLAEQNRKVEEQNRLFEKQNRETARYHEEQNRLLEEQNRETARYHEEQERQNREREWQQLEEESSRELEQQFKSRFQELFEYAEERNLIPFYVYKMSLEIPVYFERSLNYYSEKFMASLDASRKKIFDKTEKAWNKLIDYLKSEDRFLDGNEYGRCWKPKFKLVDIKQIASTHNTDFVIMKSDENLNTIFPVSLVSGYGSKSGYKVEVGEFTYLMFLKDDEEAEKVAQILSITTNCFTSTQTAVNKLISDAISEYTIANPKPQKAKEIQFLEKKNEADLNKPSLFDDDNDDRPSIISRIISIIPALLAFPFARMLYEQFFDFDSGIIAGAVTVIIAAILSAIFRKVFGVFTGILTSLSLFRFFFGDGNTLLLVLIVLAGIITGFFSIVFLRLIDWMIYIVPEKKQKKLIIEENRKIDEENKRMQKEEQEKEQACKKWEKGLINFVLKRLNNFFDNQKDVKQITD
jgi:hypothetical protein